MSWSWSWTWLSWSCSWYIECRSLGTECLGLFLVFNVGVLVLFLNLSVLVVFLVLNVVVLDLVMNLSVLVLFLILNVDDLVSVLNLSVSAMACSWRLMSCYGPGFAQSHFERLRLGVAFAARRVDVCQTKVVTYVARRRPQSYPERGVLAYTPAGSLHW